MEGQATGLGSGGLRAVGVQGATEGISLVLRVLLLVCNEQLESLCLRILV